MFNDFFFLLLNGSLSVHALFKAAPHHRLTLISVFLQNTRFRVSERSSTSESGVEEIWE